MRESVNRGKNSAKSYGVIRCVFGRNNAIGHLSQRNGKPQSLYRKRNKLD